MKKYEESIQEQLPILVVEDNIGLRRLIQRRLERENFIVEAVENGYDAISRIKESPDIILLLDYKLPEMTGLELVNRLAKENYSVPFVIMTGHGDERVAVEMMKSGARDYLVKDHALLEVLPQVMGQVISQVQLEKKLFQVKQALKESEERFKVLFNSGTDAIFVMEVRDGEAGNFVEVNDIACSRLGYSRDEFLEMSLMHIEFFEHSGIDIFGKNSLLEKKYLLYEAIQITKNGERICVENNAHMIDLDGKRVVICISRDITMRKQLEEQLRQAQKMEAVGKLAGGVAHDFNNLLTAIMGYSELLLAKMDNNNPFRETVMEIKKAGERSASLTQQLLAFSRKQIINPRTIDLNKVVSGMENMLKRIIGEDINLLSELEPNLNKINADQGNIEQIILNLSVNAGDAMPSGGTLTIKSENTRINEEMKKGMPSAQVGDFVCLSITDTGEGIEKSIIPYIFEPFFTTKKDGTGLGLSVVYGIVKQHGGWINVFSGVCKGTTFKIYFPKIQSDEVEIGESDVQLQQFIGKGEKILLVEDEEGVRRVTVKALRDFGYCVAEAESARGGLELFELEDHDFELLIIDIVLPDKSGIELMDELLMLKPRIKILLTSGYADQRAQWAEVLHKKIPFLPKPYAIGDLLKSVREVLDKKKDGEFKP